jgi:hypothetical protein
MKRNAEIGLFTKSSKLGRFHALVPQALGKASAFSLLAG